MSSVPQGLRTASELSWRVLVVAAAVIALAIVAAELRLIVLPVIFALIAATVLDPLVGWLHRHGVPRVLGALGTVLVSLAIVATIVAFLIEPLVTGFDTLVDDVGNEISRVPEEIGEGTLGLSSERVDDLVDRVSNEVEGNAESLVGGVLSGALLVGEAIAGLLMTIVLLIFFLKDGPRMWAWILERMPRRRQPVVDAAGRRTWWLLGRYLRGVVIIGLVDAVGIGVGLIIVGVPHVVPLVVLTFFGGFFPIVGAILAGSVAVFVALVSLGFVEALIVLAIVIAVQQFEGNVVDPVVLGYAVRLHPTVTLLAVTGGGVLGGIIGAFLAVPLVAVVSSVAPLFANNDIAIAESDREGSLQAKDA